MPLTTEVLEFLLILVLITNFYLLGASPLGAAIRMVGLQGVLLAGLPLLAHTQNLSTHLFFLAAGSLLVKGILIPRLLLWALRDVSLRREVHPYLGFTSSLIFGVLALAASFWLSSLVLFTFSAGSRLLLPTALFMFLCGFFLIIVRKKALSQVIGYLVMENGIYVFGMALAAKQPFVVEMGVLLDLLVGIFVMGIALYHINQEFDHIDSEALDVLRDTE